MESKQSLNQQNGFLVTSTNHLQEWEYEFKFGELTWLIPIQIWLISILLQNLQCEIRY